MISFIYVILTLSFQWYCHFDDDMYVNVPELSNLLRQYNPGKPIYIGSSPMPEYVVRNCNATSQNYSV